MVAYFRPGSLEEALVIRAEREVEIIAGGTDVYPNKATRAGWGRMGHADVLDITAIPGLDRIEDAGEHWRLGALVTWSNVVRADLPPLFHGLKAAAREIGGMQIQNRGTVVGNLCTASPAGDGIPNLIVLDATVETAARDGHRLVPIEAFLDGYRHIACRPDEIVTALRIPKRDQGARGAFLKLGARRYLVISIVMAAAVLEIDAAGLIAYARLCVGACSPVALRLNGLENRLIGRSPDEAGEAVAPADFAVLLPLDDVRASAPFRCAAAERLVRDLLAGFAVPQRRRAA